MYLDYKIKLGTIGFLFVPIVEAEFKVVAAIWRPATASDSIGQAGISRSWPLDDMRKCIQTTS